MRERHFDPLWALGFCQEMSEAFDFRVSRDETSMLMSLVRLVDRMSVCSTMRRHSQSEICASRASWFLCELGAGDDG